MFRRAYALLTFVVCLAGLTGRPALAQALDLCDQIDPDGVRPRTDGGRAALGVAVDAYHVWWDPELKSQIDLAGQTGRLHAFHICDWKTPTTDLLNDRGLMGEGCIPLRQIRAWVEAAGFRGFNEVEIFSNRLWAMDQDAFLAQIVQAYRDHV